MGAQEYKQYTCEQCSGTLFLTACRKPTGRIFCNSDCKDLFQIGSNHPNWKGGFVGHGGYLHVKSPDHPRASKLGGYVAAHILVLEKHLGRMIRENCVVHHIDGQKRNNSPANLIELTRSEHSSAHQSLNGLLNGLIENKIIWFDSETLTYHSVYGSIDIASEDCNAKSRNWRRNRMLSGKTYKKAGPKSRSELMSIIESHGIKIEKQKR